MFGIENSGKTLVLIDGANMYAATKALGFDIDFRKFYKRANESCELMRICYYTALLEENERIVIKPLVDWLAYNGYTVVTKAAKVMTNSAGVRKVKGNMDIELAMDAIEITCNAATPLAENIVFCTGDGDFVPLIEFLQKRGVRVTVVSSIETHPPLCADSLRKQADNFIELNDLRDIIQKEWPAEEKKNEEKKNIEHVAEHIA